MGDRRSPQTQVRGVSPTFLLYSRAQIFENEKEFCIVLYFQWLNRIIGELFKHVLRQKPLSNCGNCTELIRMHFV